MRNTDILYFSLNNDRLDAVITKLQAFVADATSHYYNKEGTTSRSNSRLLLDISILPKLCANNIFDLERYLSSYSRLSCLYIIIDYISLCGNCTADWRKNAELIQNIILRYPEVNFAFDERYDIRENKDFSFLDFIIHYSKFNYTTPFKKEIIDVKSKSKEMVGLMHQFDLSENEMALIKLCYIQDNLFDASGLRFLLKIKKYDDLHVGTHNFKRAQFSRHSHLALCVEEERSQSLFNCYACYANGYRSLPIITAEGLKWANENVTPDIILRDYDLQFPDEPENQTDAIMLIRGWSHIDEIRWKKCTENSEYWNKLDPTIINDDNDGKLQVFYVTKGETRMSFSLAGKTQQRIKICDGKKYDKLIIPGMQKPIAGIYAPFHEIETIKKTCRESLDKINISTKRRKGGHGVPLDIYYDVKSMVERSEKYYDERRFIHSAILAQEAMEIMNGFHEALMISAYRRKAMAENAIAANILGGDELQLRDDTIYRLHHIIKPDIHRLIRAESMSPQEEWEKTRNILNQIFNDIRIYCQDKEHFEAENAVISAMGHLNEGYPRLGIFTTLKTKLKQKRYAKEQDN